MAGVAEAVKTVTVGMGAALVWPAMLRKLDRMDPSYKTRFSRAPDRRLRRATRPRLRAAASERSEMIRMCDFST